MTTTKSRNQENSSYQGLDKIHSYELCGSLQSQNRFTYQFRKQKFAV